MGVADMLWFIHGQHVTRFAAEYMPYYNREQLPEAPVPIVSRLRTRRSAAGGPSPQVDVNDDGKIKPIRMRKPRPTKWADSDHTTEAIPDYAYGRDKDADAEVLNLKTRTSSPSPTLTAASTAGPSSHVRRPTASGVATRRSKAKRGSRRAAANTTSPTSTLVSTMPERRSSSEETCVSQRDAKLERSMSAETCVEPDFPTSDDVKAADDSSAVVDVVTTDIHEPVAEVSVRPKRKRAADSDSVPEPEVRRYSKRIRCATEKSDASAAGKSSKPRTKASTSRVRRRA